MVHLPNQYQFCEASLYCFYGTIMILLTGYISSTLHLFADDRFLYQKLNPYKTQYHSKKILTCYLTALQYGRQMKFNTTKCIVLRCSRSPTSIQYDHRLNEHVLDIKEEHPYLGIILHKSLSLSSYISKISTKASQIFNFLRQNLSKCSPTIRTSPYLTLVYAQSQNMQQ